ncbi:MAG TPA: CNNM domain-containing protein [Planctomycetota bacterium]|nr:CNNM domain-containing protein [Planctomycetota bacterium]
MLVFWIVIIGGCILLAGYYAGTETGFYRLNRVRLRFRMEAGDVRARRLDAVVRRGDRFVVTTLVGNNLFVFLATFICTRLYAPTYGTDAEWMATLTLIGPIFIFGEVLQKEIFRRSADVLMYRATGVLKWSSRLFAPAVWVLGQLQRFWTSFARAAEAERELQVERHRLYHFFSESAQEGQLSAYQHDMAVNIMKLQQLRVERVMIPAASAVSVPLDGTFETCCELARTSPYRRFPVADADGKLIGVVNVLDVLADRETPFEVRRHLREPTVFDREASVIDALHVLKRSRQPMGFVRDEGGAILGIVTIKDLVEEIVGELGEW